MSQTINVEILSLKLFFLAIKIFNSGQNKKKSQLFNAIIYH